MTTSRFLPTSPPVTHPLPLAVAGYLARYKTCPAPAPSPTTRLRRTSVVAGFYRAAVIDGLLQHSPAEHVRRPRVPVDSPTLGLTHLQLEALLTAAPALAEPMRTRVAGWRGVSCAGVSPLAGTR